jgi:hypothetical protein
MMVAGTNTIAGQQQSKVAHMVTCKLMRRTSSVRWHCNIHT